MNYLAVIALAIVVEAIIEYAKSIIKMFEQMDKKTGVTQLCAVFVAVFICTAANANLFEAVGITFSVPFVGTILTGILCSRGANFVSDIISSITTYYNGHTVYF